MRRFYLYYSSYNFSQPLIRISYNSNILHFGVIHNKAFDLYRKYIFTTCNNNVLGTIYQPYKTILVKPGDISCKKPPIDNSCSSSFGILIIFLHNTRAPDGKLAAFTIRDRFHFITHCQTFPVENHTLPVKSRNTDCTNLAYIFYSKMYTTRAGGFG